MIKSFFARMATVAALTTALMLPAMTATAQGVDKQECELVLIVATTAEVEEQAIAVTQCKDNSGNWSVVNDQKPAPSTETTQCEFVLIVATTAEVPEQAIVVNQCRTMTDPSNGDYGAWKIVI